MAKLGRPWKAGSRNRNPKDDVTPEMMQVVLETVQHLCRDHPAGVSSTEVACEVYHGNAQIFYSLKRLVTEGELVEERGVREDLHANSRCFRAVKESTI